MAVSFVLNRDTRRGECISIIIDGLSIGCTLTNETHTGNPFVTTSDLLIFTSPEQYLVLGETLSRQPMSMMMEELLLLLMSQVLCMIPCMYVCTIVT